MTADFTNCHKKQGFTLVELSIVLVVIGLMTGGIIAGRTLVRASEIRTITTQFAHIQGAVAAFKEKYNAIPGDMNNAQSYWGVAHATPATCATTASTSDLTCNGDGNGRLSLAAAGSNESFRFWQHLASAGFLNGQYSGISQGSTIYSATPANSPAGELVNSLWFVTDYGTASSGTLFDGIYDNSYVFGGYLVNDTPMTLTLKPEEAWSVDVKMDDGKPAIGKVRSRTNSFATCTDTSSYATLTANYAVTSTAFGCNLIFPQAL